MKHWQIEAALQWELKFGNMEEARRKKSEAVMYECSEEDSEDVMNKEDNWYEEWEEEEERIGRNEFNFKWHITKETQKTAKSF